MVISQAQAFDCQQVLHLLEANTQRSLKLNDLAQKNATLKIKYASDPSKIIKISSNIMILGTKIETISIENKVYCEKLLTNSCSLPSMCKENGVSK